MTISSDYMLWRAAVCFHPTRQKILWQHLQTQSVLQVDSCTDLWLVQSRYTIEESFHTTTVEDNFLTVFKNSLTTVSYVRFRVITLQRIHRILEIRLTTLWKFVTLTSA